MDINKIVTESLNEILNDNQSNKLDNKIKCIQSILEKENIKHYKLSGGKDGLWVDIRQILREIKNYFKDGYFMSDDEEEKSKFDSFLNNLNYSNSHTYKKGENVGRLPVSKSGFTNSDMKIYRAIGDKTLFRGVSLKDWNRIKIQGYIDTDMRDAIVETEGINLGQIPGTARYYLPADDKGVILAISPQNLDLYMLDDEYIRVFKPIPIKNIIKVSNIYIKNNEGVILTVDTEKRVNKIINKVKEFNITINC